MSTLSNTQHSQGYRLKKLGSGLLLAIAVLFLLLFVLVPVAWLFISSISSSKDLLQMPPVWLPWPPDFSRYKQLLFGTAGQNTTLTDFTLRAFRYSLRNSLIIAGSVTVVALIFGSMAGYAFARIKLPLGNKLIYVLLVSQMIPVAVLLIPLYITIGKLGMLDKLTTVIGLLVSIHLPFVIWMLRGYFQTLPAEMEEAALVDGANRLQVITQVILPVSLPGLFSAAAYTFMQSWNAFMIPLIFTSSDTARSVTVAIAMFVGRNYTDYSLMCAAGVLASLPPVLLAVFFQRYLLAGLTAGAVKG
jgi:ABC-type sugar transport system, permease component